MNEYQHLPVILMGVYRCIIKDFIGPTAIKPRVVSRGVRMHRLNEMMKYEFWYGLK
jgi:hypothetical protein